VESRKEVVIEVEVEVEVRRADEDDLRSLWSKSFQRLEFVFFEGKRRLEHAD
jgi:uncharacterized Zn finger protein